MVRNKPSNDISDHFKIKLPKTQVFNKTTAGSYYLVYALQIANQAATNHNDTQIGMSTSNVINSVNSKRSLMIS
jgi:hypothetical protein